MGRAALTKSTTKKRAPTAAEAKKNADRVAAAQQRLAAGARNAKTLAAGASGGTRRKSSDVGDGVTMSAETRPARKRATRT